MGFKLTTTTPFERGVNKSVYITFAKNTVVVTNTGTGYLVSTNIDYFMGYNAYIQNLPKYQSDTSRFSLAYDDNIVTMIKNKAKEEIENLYPNAVFEGDGLWVDVTNPLTGNTDRLFITDICHDYFTLKRKSGSVMELTCDYALYAEIPSVVTYDETITVYDDDLNTVPTTVTRESRQKPLSKHKLVREIDFSDVASTTAELIQQVYAPILAKHDPGDIVEFVDEQA
jgi:hypothetical protein